MSWTFLSNHAHVLFCLAHTPALTLREVAQRVGITERAVQGIVRDLSAEGYLQVVKEGRQNRYRLVPHRPLRHPIEAHQSVDALMDLLKPPEENPSQRVGDGL